MESCEVVDDIGPVKIVEMAPAIEIATYYTRAALARHQIQTILDPLLQLKTANPK